VLSGSVAAHTPAVRRVAGEGGRRFLNASPNDTLPSGCGSNRSADGSGSS